MGGRRIMGIGEPACHRVDWSLSYTMPMSHHSESTTKPLQHTLPFASLSYETCERSSIAKDLSLPELCGGGPVPPELRDVLFHCELSVVHCGAKEKRTPCTRKLADTYTTHTPLDHSQDR